MAATIEAKVGLRAVAVALAAVAVAVAVAALWGCAPAPTTTSTIRTTDSGVVARHAPTEEGRASYYARIFDGRRTASGETYDPERLTAAHPSLPFGTWIRVTRADGRWVEVRVNDRCGCGGGRIVDLSRAAARRLDMMRAGIVRVRLEVIRK